MQSLGNHNDNILISRLILLWILIEVVLGGTLHTLKIPLSGLIVGNIAIVCIYLLIRNTHQTKQVFRALFMVMTFKWLLSPQASIFAYVAMSIQTMVMLPIRLHQNSRALSVICVCIASLYSPIQKLGILYLLLGEEHVFDVFLLADRWLGIQGGSYWLTIGLVSLYMLLYVLGAVLTAGIVISLSGGIRLDVDLLKQWKEYSEQENLMDTVSTEVKNKKTKRILIKGLLVVLLISIFLYIDLTQEWLIRLGLLLAFYLVVSLSMRYLSTRYKESYYDPILRIKKEIPAFKKMISFCRHYSGLGSTFQSVKLFVVAIFQLFLFTNPNSDGLSTQSTR